MKKILPIILTLIVMTICVGCEVTPAQVGDFIMDVVKHLLGEAEGLGLIAIVAAAVIKASNERDSRIGDTALRVFNIVEKLGRLDPKLDKARKFAEVFLTEYQKDNGKGPGPHAKKVAAKVVEKEVAEANRIRTA
jgi:hypothetical protein